MLPLKLREEINQRAAPQNPEIERQQTTPFQTYARPILKYCCLIFSNKKQCDRKKIGNVLPIFIKQLFGCSASLNYTGSRESLKLDPLELQRTETNMMLLDNIITNGSCVHAPHFSDPPPYSLRNTKFIINSPGLKTSVRAKLSLVIIRHYGANSPKICAFYHHHFAFKQRDTWDSHCAHLYPFVLSILT